MTSPTVRTNVAVAIGRVILRTLERGFGPTLGSLDISMAGAGLFIAKLQPRTQCHVLIAPVVAEKPM